MATMVHTAARGLDAVRFTSRNPVEPLAGTWQMRCAPDPQTFQVPAPPANNSPVTAAELAELLVLTRHRTPQDIRQILRWSVNEPSLASHWTRLADVLIHRYHLSPPAAGRVHAAMLTAMEAGLLATWREKFRHLRPRPTVLDPSIDVSIISVPEHPAYPGGHSTAAGAAATILGHFFPAERGLVEQVAQDSGVSRLKAGIHYRSDHTSGLQVGRQAAKAVIAEMLARDGGPQFYSRPPGVPRLTLQQFLAFIDSQPILR